MPGPAHYQQDPTSENLDADHDDLQSQIKPQKPKKSFMFSSTSKRLYSPPAIVTVSLFEYIKSSALGAHMFPVL